MKEQERRLFKALCAFQEGTIDEGLANYATPSVLGHLFFNRMSGVAYDKLKQSNIMGKVNREFRNSLSAAYEQNRQKNLSFLTCVEMVAKLLSKCDCKVAMLKGAYLCAHYPEGYRTSNDIDLLVAPQDVTILGKFLSEEGFEQGNIRNGEFVPATRREIIESRMMRGETVPYVKEVNLPFMKFLEVDVNFSLDYKPGDTFVLLDMLSRVSMRCEKGIYIPTLDTDDFFIHLCAHLYTDILHLAELIRTNVLCWVYYIILE